MSRNTLCDGFNPKTSPDYWVPANGGSETPFISRSGKHLQYLWNMNTGEHAYIDCDADIILTDDEAEAALMLR